MCELCDIHIDELQSKVENIKVFEVVLKLAAEFYT